MTVTDGFQFWLGKLLLDFSIGFSVFVLVVGVLWLALYLERKSK